MASLKYTLVGGGLLALLAILLGVVINSDNIEDWIPPTDINLAATIPQQCTTCSFDIELYNNGNKDLNISEIFSNEIVKSKYKDLMSNLEEQAISTDVVTVNITSYTYKNTTKSYECNETIGNTTYYASCSIYNDTAGNWTPIFRKYDYDSTEGDVIYWTEREVNETIITQKEVREFTVPDSTIKNFKIEFNETVWEQGTLIKVTYSGKINVGTAVDVFPEVMGFTFEAAQVWNSSLYSDTAVPNVSGPVMSSGECIFYTKTSNCTDGSGRLIWNSTSNNASCRQNLNTESGTSEDWSDIEFYDSRYNTTLQFIPLVNITKMSHFINSTDDTLLWDAFRVLNCSLNETDSTSIRISTNGSQSGSPNSDTNTDLVGWWEFERSLVSGGQLNDWSGNGLAMSATNAQFWQNSSCDHGNDHSNLGCYFFDNNGDYLTETTATGFASGQGFSIEYWFNAYDNPAVNMIVDHYDASSDGGIRSYTAGGVLSASILADNGQTVTVTTTTAISTSTWYHFAFTFDGSRNLTIYLNGVYNNSGLTGGATDAFKAIPFNLGREWSSNSDWWYYGIIDGFKIYNRTLSGDEVSALYNTPAHLRNDAWAPPADTTAPTITIYAPIDNFNTTDTQPVHWFEADEDSDCTVYYNGTAYDTNASVTAEVNTSFTVNTSLSQNEYLWDINCTDASSNEGTITDRTLIIGNTSSTIALCSPLTGLAFTPSQSGLNATGPTVTITQLNIRPDGAGDCVINVTSSAPFNTDINMWSPSTGSTARVYLECNGYNTTTSNVTIHENLAPAGTKLLNCTMNYDNTSASNLTAIDIDFALVAS
jgi:hypothetical protein